MAIACISKDDIPRKTGDSEEALMRHEKASKMFEKRYTIFYCRRCGHRAEGLEGEIGAGPCCGIARKYVSFTEDERDEAERVIARSMLYGTLANRSH